MLFMMIKILHKRLNKREKRASTYQVTFSWLSVIDFHTASAAAISISVSPFRPFSNMPCIKPRPFSSLIWSLASISSPHYGGQNLYFCETRMSYKKEDIELVQMSLSFSGSKFALKVSLLSLERNELLENEHFL